MVRFAGKTRVDEKNPNILHLEWTNTRFMPQSTTPVVYGYSGFSKKEQKQLNFSFKLFMVTRRSSINPGETAKLRLELSCDPRELPREAVFEAYLVTHGEYSSRVDFSLHPEGELT